MSFAATPAAHQGARGEKPVRRGFGVLGGQTGLLSRNQPASFIISAGPEVGQAVVVAAWQPETTVVEHFLIGHTNQAIARIRTGKASYT